MSDIVFAAAFPFALVAFAVAVAIVNHALGPLQTFLAVLVATVVCDWVFPEFGGSLLIGGVALLFNLAVTLDRNESAEKRRNQPQVR